MANGEQTEKVNSPLWLPDGSVRAILTIVLVVSVVGLQLWQGVVSEPIMTLAGLAVGNYFGGRGAVR